MSEDSIKQYTKRMMIRLEGDVDLIGKGGKGMKKLVLRRVKDDLGKGARGKHLYVEVYDC